MGGLSIVWTILKLIHESIKIVPIAWLVSRIWLIIRGSLVRSQLGPQWKSESYNIKNCNSFLCARFEPGFEEKSGVLTKIWSGYISLPTRTTSDKCLMAHWKRKQICSMQIFFLKLFKWHSLSEYLCRMYWPFINKNYQISF